MRKVMGLGIAAVLVIAIVFVVTQNNDEGTSEAPVSTLARAVKNIAGGEVAQSGAVPFRYRYFPRNPVQLPTTPMIHQSGPWRSAEAR
jgi:hypothetical protein